VRCWERIRCGRLDNSICRCRTIWVIGTWISRLHRHGRRLVWRNTRLDRWRLFQIDNFRVCRVWSQRTGEGWLLRVLPSSLTWTSSWRRTQVLAALNSEICEFCRLDDFQVFAFLLKFDVMIPDLLLIVSSVVKTNDLVARAIPFGWSLSACLPRSSQRLCLQFQSMPGSLGNAALPGQTSN